MQANRESASLVRPVSNTRTGADPYGRNYRDQALKLYPHICGRCGRTFTHSNLHELTVHHRDHNHGHNPTDGSNWELLCLYCHDNEHQRQLVARGSGSANPKAAAVATGNPFSGLKELLKAKQKD